MEEEGRSAEGEIEFELREPDPPATAERTELSCLPPDNVGDDDALPIVMSHANAEQMGLGDLFDRLDVGPALERGMDGLPELFREIVALVDLEGFSYHEAAEILEVPVGTVRSRLFRARRRLQDHLIEQARDMGLGSAKGGES